MTPPCPVTRAKNTTPRSISHHPDTGQASDTFTVPLWDRVIATALSAAAAFSHFHMLFLDGVYVERPDRPLRFHWMKAPTSVESPRPTQTLAWCIGRYLKRQGLLERDVENSYLAGDDLEAGPVEQLLGSSITYRYASRSLIAEKHLSLAPKSKLRFQYANLLLGLQLPPAEVCWQRPEAPHKQRDHQQQRRLRVLSAKCSCSASYSTDGCCAEKWTSQTATARSNF